MNKYVVEKKLNGEFSSKSFNAPDPAIEYTFAQIRSVTDPYKARADDPIDANCIINRTIIRGKQERVVGYIRCYVEPEKVVVNA